MLKNIIISFFIVSLLTQISLASTIRFAQISDIHYAITDKNDLRYIYHSNILDETINKINNDSMIQFTLITGDTCMDTFEESKNIFLKLNNLNNNWYFILGNHEFIEGDKEKYISFLKQRNPNIFNKNKLFYSFKPQKDITFIGLDTVVKAHGPMGNVSKEQMEYMEKILQNTSSNDVVIIFSHHPLIRINGVSYIYNQKELDNLFNKYNIPIIFLSGHLHSPIISHRKNIINAVSPAQMYYPGIYRIITIGNSEYITVIDFDYDKVDKNDINSWSKVMSFVYGGYDKINENDFKQTIIIKKKIPWTLKQKVWHYLVCKYYLFKHKINLKYSAI